MRFFHSILTFFIIVFTLFSEIHGVFNIEEFDRRLNALWKVVNYITRRAEKMNLDGLFGLTLAEAYIMATLSHPNAHFIPLDRRNLLANIGKTSDDTRRFIKKTIKPENKMTAILEKVLTYPEPWIQPIEWKYGLLKKPILRKFNDTDKMNTRVFYNGTPLEEESDYCISNMMNGYPKDTCKVAKECELMLLRSDNSQGYPLTHRLLLVWIAKTFRCEELQLTTYVELVPQYCSSILQNLVDIESLGFPSPGIDLACEEVILCGSEGYLEFANDYYANLIMSYQQPITGCFNGLSIKKKNHSRVRRTIKITEKGCESHATGLGAASLALLIRQYVETSTYV